MDKRGVMYKLVIVESPAKAKTIEAYLGSEYRVISSVGHVRDLATSGFRGYGIDVEDDFKASYKYIKGKKKVVNDIKKIAKDADFIYIATDPDREGEAIGWHLADELNLDLNQKNRIAFNEITKDGVTRGLENVCQLDMNLVKSQETRRKIDRIMGFDLSKLLQKKISAKSAGRVQSVALQMIVYREKEITDFIPTEYYKIIAQNSELNFEWENNAKKLGLIEVQNEFDKIKNENELIVTDIKNRQKTVNPKPAYITSTFQQDVINRLSMDAKKAMSIAQKLYEGILIDGQLTGLITYMRTDSTRLNSGFIASCRSFIKENHGEEYLKTAKEKKVKEGAQDAHEAIRPTSIYLTPQSVKKQLTKDQFVVYDLIYKRALASLMASCKQKTTTYILSKNDVNFKTSNTVNTFAGYTVIYNDLENIVCDKVFKKDEVIKIDSFDLSQHFTKPKARYSEAKLIKHLEESQIGRPSTYAAIIDVIKKRNYVEVIDKRFKPTEMGIVVIKNLDAYFSEIVNVQYTSDMEQSLDCIADAKCSDLEVLNDFYNNLDRLVKSAQEKMPDKEIVKSGNICPDCGSDLIIRSGRYGEFEGCSNFPKCRYIVPTKQEVICKCPECEDGDIVEKKTKRLKIFYACTNYPKCKFAKWNLEEITNKKED